MQGERGGGMTCSKGPQVAAAAPRTELTRRPDLDNSDTHNDSCLCFFSSASTLKPTKL